ncbi:hypothetical protein ES703_88416 [subsurface metagenome]
MTELWYPLTISQTMMAGGFEIVLTTDRPCHLWLFWTDKAPWTHRVTRLERGLLVPWDAYWCFVAWHMIPQEEAGDTTEHTFSWLGWVNCQTKYFRFHGTIGLATSPSDSPIFHKHYLWTAPAIQTLRPNGTAPWGDICPECTSIIMALPNQAHYRNVKEVIPDEEATILFVRTSPTPMCGECFALDDPVPGGAISNVRVVTRAKDQSTPATCKVLIAFGDGVYYDSPTFNLTANYANYGHDWPINPHTSAPWTWEEIANLAPGYGMCGQGFNPPHLTQLYVEVSA